MHRPPRPNAREQASDPWRRALAAPDAIERLLWIAASSAVPLLTERCLQLLAALLSTRPGAAQTGGADGGAPNRNGLGDGAAAATASAAAEEEGDGGSGSVLQAMLSAGLLDVVCQLLLSILSSLPAPGGAGPGGSPGAAGGSGGRRSGGGWEDDSDAESGGDTPGAAAGAAGAGAAASGGGGGREPFEPAAAAALLALVLEVAGSPEGAAAISDHREASEAAGGRAGGACGLLIELLVACGREEAASNLRKQVVLASSLLPDAWEMILSDPAAAAAVADALADSDRDDLDLVDACWYLLALFLKAAAARRGAAAGTSHTAEEGPDVGGRPAVASEAAAERAVLARAAEMARRFSGASDAAARYVAEVLRCLGEVSPG